MPLLYRCLVIACVYGATHIIMVLCTQEQNVSIISVLTIVNSTSSIQTLKKHRRDFSHHSSKMCMMKSPLWFSFLLYNYLILNRNLGPKAKFQPSEALRKKAQSHSQNLSTFSKSFLPRSKTKTSLYKGSRTLTHTVA